MCPFRTNSVKKEGHFVFCCSGLGHLRRQYIHLHLNYWSYFPLTLLLYSKTERTLRHVARYLYKSVNRREVIMSGYFAYNYAKIFTMDLSLCSCVVLCIFCILYLTIDSRYVCTEQCWKKGVQTEYHLCNPPSIKGCGLIE